VLFLAKEKPFAREAAELLRLHMSGADIFFGGLADPFPPSALEQHYDYVISYISPWIVPQQVLEHARIAAINFHPGPPEYPGIGCTNFALYNGAQLFGVTVHHMKAQVDSGAIIMVDRFPILPHDTVFSLSQRCYASIAMVFARLFPILLAGQSLPQSTEQWTRSPYTRRELDALCRITKDMSDEEVRRRIRATRYPGMPGAYIEIAGEQFHL